MNNAAYTHLLTHEELTFHRWQRFMRTNLDGPFLTMWAAKEDMTTSGGGSSQAGTRSNRTGSNRSSDVTSNANGVVAGLTASQ